MKRSSLVALVLLALVLTPLTAAAQEASRAQALFDEGKLLMTEGHFAEACPKLAASQRLDPGAGTLMNLATCYEKNGQNASAWATFKEAAAASRASGHPDWEALARGRADKLQPELPRLVVNVPKEAQHPGLVVERDGSPIDPAEWASAIPIDAGPHTIRALAPGRKTWSMEVTVGGPRSQVTVAVPALEGESSAAAPPPTAPGIVDAPSSDAGSTQRIVGLVTGGVGIVAVGVGAVFGLKASSTYDDAVKGCNASHQCSQSALDHADDATSQATISTIGFVAGSLLVAGGVVLYLTAPHGAKTTGSVRVTPGGPGLAGMTLGGAF